MYKKDLIIKKSNYLEADITEIISPSSVEMNTPYQRISGAPYIHIPLEEQKKMKYQVSIDVFKRIGKQDNIENYFDEWISSPNSFHYRNKMEYSFSSIRHDLETDKELDDEFSLGFKHAGTWWKVENLDKDKISDRVYKSVLYSDELLQKAYESDSEEDFDYEIHNIELNNESTS